MPGQARDDTEFGFGSVVGFTAARPRRNGGFMHATLAILRKIILIPSRDRGVRGI